ncbi:hypothetical protein HYH02_002737 [Chlamydomonas schloesseri]|uniref:Uncharacterized protein n=1 Tax=Chlamydomonas schloesseri TaxID=2026947 RepID=A0A836BAJ0_9CHLO|nr:hypothetical protein HYH02_002737 [Chlamydomonas schloesseri]|eukprot:KAG2452498.1 hypothetical protein HYH02_002737 [Chlamydomonas schloesseri]
MDILAAYSSSDDEQEPKGQIAPAGAQKASGRPAQRQRRGGAAPARHAADSDSETDSSDESVDSAALRAAEAAARLRDYGENGATATSGRTGGAAQKRSLLPSALDVLDAVEGPPRFLDPEAIRPLAASASHGLGADTGPAVAVAAGKERQAPGKDFDISKLAPPMKGQAKQSADKREAPAGAVIEGRAKRYKAEEGPEATQSYTALQIAMLGGHVAEQKSAPTKPMEVSEFLNKGVGAAQLPRKNADRKDKEKDKRMRGQSTHSHWKSEAEMVLRQQYDS